MTKLFISHASEDKEEFVRPLALELRRRFEVWYDEFALKLGDSLRSSIDAGLRTCDFGVVVISPAFFAKKWTVAELNALFALEDTNRKVILPVWLNLTAEQVRQQSPLLADRLAVSASKGIDRVVEEIAVAVSVSNRAHDVLSPDFGKRAMDDAMATIASRELDENLLRTEVGVQLFQHAENEIRNHIWARLSSYNSDKTQRFVHPKGVRGWVVHGPHRTCLSVGGKQVYLNSVHDAQLVAEIYVGTSHVAQQREPNTLEELNWFPTCISSEAIGFRHHPEDTAWSPLQVSTKILTQYATWLAKRTNEQRGGR
jgi:hypothetical protein